MGKKRKSVASKLDEVDRTMYSTFCSAASSLSQLYTQTLSQQKLSFLAGERHGLEKLYQWILRQEEEGVSGVSTIDIVNYLQNELDFYGEEPSLSPRVSFQHPHSQPATTHFTYPSISSGSSAPITAGQVGQVGQVNRHEHHHQSRNPIFSNVLSSPVRQSLQNYHLSNGNYNLNSGNGTQNSEPNQARDSELSSSMDMHSDSPDHGGRTPY